MDFWLVILLIVGAVWLFRRTRRRAHVDVAAQVVVERMTAELLTRYPRAPDILLLQLLRDDLHNRLHRDPLLYAWANLETVGRVRRTILRAQWEPGPQPPEVLEEEPEEDDDVLCEGCRMPLIEPDDAKCWSCGRARATLATRSSR